MTPPVQALVPLAHSPCLPETVQAPPPPGLPLSTTPLQSLSLPSQTSAVGNTTWGQAIAPAVQTVTLLAHSPCSPVTEHATPPPGLPLSTTPSQSLSRPSQ